MLSTVSDLAYLYVWYECAIYGLFAMATNVVVGWNGVGTFGQALYFSAGAYTVAVMEVHHVGIAPEVLLLVGGCIAAIVAVFFGLLATRTGSYVAMAMLTLMFAQVGYQILYGMSFFGGADGISLVPRGAIFGVSLKGNVAFDWYMVVVIAICWYALARLRRSTVAHAMFAVKDDPIRARASGLSVKGLQIMGFVIGGFFAGIAGALFVQAEGTATPDLGYWTTSGVVLMMVIIGGSRYLWGPALGALLYSWVNYELLGTTSYMDVYLGCALLVIVLFAPNGVGYLLIQGFRKVAGGVSRVRRRAG